MHANWNAMNDLFFTFPFNFEFHSRVVLSYQEIFV